MSLLLDTHILLWWIFDESPLPARARAAIEAESRVHVSMATVWEIGIKRSLGKLNAPDDLEGALIAERFQLLPITFAHVHEVVSLPQHHGDPFDRMLVAQARTEKLTLVSADRRMDDYDVERLPL